ncbi:MAG TPA: FAD-dependent oxidoreductase [Thermoanaerobaculia bacterium]|nr:FAD-dependent oxidoreductase [Thermoanaerobaculia bacterium]
MTDSTGGWTRRRFLEMVGKAGGAAAVYETMTTLGMINVPEAWAGPPRLPRAGKQTSVLVLGAGVGGLTAAYDLLHAGGYSVTVLEAQNRPGGRSLTARNGTKIVEKSTEHGETHQECKFDHGLYLNMGPGRLPYHHRRALHYCRELKVPLEVYVMSTSANLFQTPDAFGKQAQINRRMAYDTQGYISELLTKAVKSKCLDQELHEGDREKLLDLLKVFGDLGATKDCAPDAYCGSTRAGCEKPLTVFQACEPEKKLDFHELLQSEFWRHKFYQPMEFEWQPTLFQPVGGMDKLVHGFVTHLPEGMIHYQCEVRHVQLHDHGVEVTYWDAKQKKEIKKTADFCISNIPLPVLQKVNKTNFAPDFLEAIKQCRFAFTCKVGWQANERFWENDKYQIYGGISYIFDLVTQIWYPSNDYFSAKGTLTGTYNYDADAETLGAMDLQKRLNTARAGGALLHPEFLDDKIVPQALGLSIAWHNIPYQEGGWADWKSDSEPDRKAYARLLAPDGRFYVVGDQVSTLPGWQEGAMMSAEHVLQQIAGMRPKTVPEILAAPETRRLVQGRF